MATRTVIELIDDLDGSEASQTVRFALDGPEYEIDLSEQNAESLRGTLQRFVDTGRRTSGTTRRQASPSTASSADTKAVRRWAAENGINVKTRGRISEDVVRQYQAARI